MDTQCDITILFAERRRRDEENADWLEEKGGDPNVARNQCHVCFEQFALEKQYVEHMFAQHGVQR